MYKKLNMENSSDFSVSEIEKLITIANYFGIELPEEKSASIDWYLKEMINKLEKIPYTPFPVSFHTVDIAMCVAGLDMELNLLMGRKPGNTVFQFIGGFMDPGETSWMAAIRELFEETNVLIVKEQMEYLGSFFIDDHRFKNSCHKITTSFYVAVGDIDIMGGLLAKDDIEEVRLFKIPELILNDTYKTIIAKLHQPLFERLIEWIETKEHL